MLHHGLLGRFHSKERCFTQCASPTLHPFPFQPSIKFLKRGGDVTVRKRESIHQEIKFNLEA